MERVIVAVIVALLLVLVVKDSWLIASFIGGFVLAVYVFKGPKIRTLTTGGGVTGGYCPEDFDDVHRKTRRGYKAEATLLAMLNCYVKKGEFRPLDPGKPGHPRWLHRIDAHTPSGIVELSLDGFNPDSGAGPIAFEYNGQRHYLQEDQSWDAFQRYIGNDRVKRQLFARQNVKFILVHCGVHKRLWSDYIKSRLQDLGALDEAFKEFTYIPEIPEPQVQRTPRAPVRKRRLALQAPGWVPS